jgi:hypothetical protein
MLLSRKATVTPLIICACILGVGLIQLPRLEKLLNSKKSASLESLEKDVKAEKIKLDFLKKVIGYI